VRAKHVKFMTLSVQPRRKHASPCQRDVKAINALQKKLWICGRLSIVGSLSLRILVDL